MNLANVQSITVKAEDDSERIYDFSYEIEAYSGNEITGFMLKKAANPGESFIMIFMLPLLILYLQQV